MKGGVQSKQKQIFEFSKLIKNRDDSKNNEGYLVTTINEDLNNMIPKKMLERHFTSGDDKDKTASQLFELEITDFNLDNENPDVNKITIRFNYKFFHIQELSRYVINIIFATILDFTNTKVSYRDM